MGIQRVLNAIETRISMMIKEGELGVVGTTDEAAMGYFVVRWLSEPYSLQADTVGMSGVIGAGTMVVNAIYYNRVARAPFWYTQSGETTVIEVRFVLLTGLEVEEVSAANPLPQACNRMEATWQQACRATVFDHEAIMEEAERRDWLEYDEEEEQSDGKLMESELESDGE